MLELEFTAEDMARTRFAISPLWEVVAGLRVLLGADEQGLHRRWAEPVRARIAAAKLDLTPLAALVPPPSPSVPGFICPPPTTPWPSLEVELTALRRTPRELLRALSPHARPGVDAILADPDRRLGELADLIEAYWEIAMAPYWPRIRTLLESDILYRARRFAEGGTRLLFDDLDPQLGWDDGTLQIAHRYVRGVHTLAGRGLILVPSAFVWPRVFSTTDPADLPVLRYPPRGIGTLWETRPSPASPALAGVLGRSRARLLTELAAPATTTDLARRTGLTPGGTSQHLTALRASGLVTAHRAGRVVLYARTRVAEELLNGAGA
ncbi:ArsR/SmtB family transcription factor [Streptomyces sp. NBC_01304]|uniref:ArsR/SmtB family transcription factor n=1 Tax=Streptomyces sp. NBC_01304 TaxID=2903818 RepID=UPI002E1272CB|nr:winged helix-turn-helix domain-containing protein [Streptomyces sp. NBC_01304]